MATDVHFEDPWQLLPNRLDVATGEPERPRLQIETIECVEPLDAQLGTFPKKTVPDALYEPLFGQPAPLDAEIAAVGGDPDAVPPMRTYAILDAAKVTNLPELLERSGLEHRCLFKGKAFDELKNVAPWLVRIEEGSSFARNLFVDGEFPWNLWSETAGIYARSRWDIEPLWRHLRKFTRIPDENGRWSYFAFWRGYVPRAMATSRLFDSLIEKFFPPFSSLISRPDEDDLKMFVIVDRG